MSNCDNIRLRRGHEFPRITGVECRAAVRGVATGWTAVDMSTPLLPETIPEIDADPASFFLGGGVAGRGAGFDLSKKQWGSFPFPSLLPFPSLPLEVGPLKSS